jgi:hypothetical protein
MLQLSDGEARKDAAGERSIIAQPAFPCAVDSMDDRNGGLLVGDRTMVVAFGRGAGNFTVPSEMRDNRRNVSGEMVLNSKLLFFNGNATTNHNHSANDVSLATMNL